MVTRASTTEAGTTTPLRIGVSSCLLGERVRFDGGHKRDSFLADTLGAFVEFVTVCPEMELGLASPRDSMRLEAGEGGPRLVVTKTRVDLTARMHRFTREKVRELEKLDLSGFVLKKDSPSCGMARVRMYGAHGMAERTGRGLFAEGLMEAMPLLPVEEEGRLSDARLRENFVERLFGYRRVTDLFARAWSVDDLVRFHTREKFLLLAHDEARYREMGRLVAKAKEHARAELRDRYRALYMTALARLATAKRHANVLEHMLGFMKDELSAAEKEEMLGLVRDHRAGLVPLVVPLTLMRHFVRRHGVAYLEGQHYLEPHPKELMLRNHV